MDLRLPDLGEGIASATVTAVAVKPGDSVEADQTVLEVETEKASMPVPSPTAGKVAEVRVKPGDVVKPGAVLLVLADGAAKGKSEAPAAQPPAKAPPPTPSRQPQPSRPAAGQATAAPKTQPTGETVGPVSRIDVRIPDLGEGIEGGTVTNVAVKPGDDVSTDQPLIELETEKASLPVPAPSPGRVEEVRVKPGDKVKIGQVIAVLVAQPVAATHEPVPTVRTASPQPRPEQRPQPQPQPQAQPQAAPQPPRPHAPVTGNGRGGEDWIPPPASPATRRFARELQVDLHEVPGSGRGGRITIEDVKAYVRGRMEQAPAAAPSGAGFAPPPLPDFSKFGPVERKPVSNLRKTIAKNLSIAWQVCPMVTQYDQADITELEAGRKRIGEGLPKGSPKVTMTVLAVKAVVAALKEFPHFNASFDAPAGELIYKQYFHIGIAVDTERGLVVPVIRDADRKSVRDLAREVSELAEKARGNKLSLDEMRGGTFTITNLGGIGGTAFSPIVNYPEVAILGMARSSLQPVIRDGKVEPRLILPLCLTYDHRVIDGADGARFTARLAQLFSDPIRLLMES